MLLVMVAVSRDAARGSILELFVLCVFTDWNKGREGWGGGGWRSVVLFLLDSLCGGCPPHMKSVHSNEVFTQWLSVGDVHVCMC